MTVKMLSFMYTYCNLSTGRHGYPCTFNLLQCILLFIFSAHKNKTKRGIFLALSSITWISTSIMIYFNLVWIKKLKSQSVFMHKLHLDIKSKFPFNRLQEFQAHAPKSCSWATFSGVTSEVAMSAPYAEGFKMIYRHHNAGSFCAPHWAALYFRELVIYKTFAQDTDAEPGNV